MDSCIVRVIRQLSGAAVFFAGYAFNTYPAGFIIKPRREKNRQRKNTQRIMISEYRWCVVSLKKQQDQEVRLWDLLQYLNGYRCFA